MRKADVVPVFEIYNCTPLIEAFDFSKSIYLQFKIENPREFFSVKLRRVFFLNLLLYRNNVVTLYDKIKFKLLRHIGIPTNLNELVFIAFTPTCVITITMYTQLLKQMVLRKYFTEKWFLKTIIFVIETSLVYIFL